MRTAARFCLIGLLAPTLASAQVARDWGPGDYVVAFSLSGTP